MRGFLFDLRYSLRTLCRNPAFALGATILLALGVGANSSIFSLSRALVFQKLPFQDSERLVAVWKERVQTGRRQGASWPDLADWGAQKHVFEGLAAYMDETGYASPPSGIGSAEPVTDIHVTQAFFCVLGIKPAIGREFSPHEFAEQHAIASEEPVIISHAFWRERMSAGTDVLGKFITIGPVRHSVVGVLPRGFRMFRSSTPEVFSPLRAFPGHSLERRMAYLTVVARLKPGVTISQARAAMSVYSQRAAREHPETEAGLRCNLEGLHEHWFGSLRPLMFLLLGAVALVLCIVCANLAFLFLIRAMRREREIALRKALGAGTRRVCSQLMIEALLLALVGGVAGSGAALWSRDLFSAFSSAADMRLPPLQFDGVVIGFTILISLATTALFGLVPAWRASNLDLYGHLKRGASSMSDGFASHFGRVAVIGQIAFSTLLIAGAATLLKSFIAISRTHPGFQADSVLTLSLGQVPLREGFQQREDYFWSQLLDRTASLPGVQAAALCRAFPLSEDAPPARMITRITPEGRPSRDPEGSVAEFQDVTAGYFRALGIPLLMGRAFDARDALKTDPRAYQPVAVINQTLARELWGSEDPLGKRIISGGKPYTVVGIAADVKQHKLWRTAPEYVVYRPLWLSDLFKMSSHYVVVRSFEDPARISADLKALVRSIEPERPVISVRTMEEVIFQSAAWERLRLSIVALFGAAAFILTIAGVYAVVSYSVMLKRREIGIRIALGGQPDRIQAMVLRQGAVVAAAGASGGAVAAWVLSRVLSARLHGVDVLGLPTLLSIWLVVFAATVIACYFPARKATKVDPLLSLRAE